MVTIGLHLVHRWLLALPSKYQRRRPILPPSVDAFPKDGPQVNSPDPVSAVQRYIEAFNLGDVQAMAAMCASPMSILDGMAPHVWHGPSATQDWYKDVLTEGEHLGAKGYRVTLGKPLTANVTGDAAYVVVPATMSFRLKDKQVTQSGALLTMALHKLPEGWRIASWAWTKGTAVVS